MNKIKLAIFILTLASNFLGLSVFQVNINLDSTLALINRGTVTLNIIFYLIIFITIIDQFMQVEELTFGRNIARNIFLKKMIQEIIKLTAPIFCIQIFISIIFDITQLKVGLILAFNLLFILVIITWLVNYFQLNKIFTGLLILIAIDSITNFTLFFANQNLLLRIIELLIILISMYELIKDRRYAIKSHANNLK